jgi:U3 small nucleolar RNA-associated protein 18
MTTTMTTILRWAAVGEKTNRVQALRRRPTVCRAKRRLFVQSLISVDSHVDLVLVLVVVFVVVEVEVVVVVVVVDVVVRPAWVAPFVVSRFRHSLRLAHFETTRVVARSFNVLHCVGFCFFLFCCQRVTMISNSKRRAAISHGDVGLPEKKARPMSSKEVSLSTALFGSVDVDDVDDDNDDDDDDNDDNDNVMNQIRNQFNNNNNNNNDNDDDDDDNDNDDDDDDDDDSDVPNHQQPRDSDDVDVAPSVWHDDDDEPLNADSPDSDAAAVPALGQIDIANVARLRKLRKSHAETSVDAATYSKRLREQFRRLQPHNTAWAQVAPADADADDDDPAAALARTAKPLVDAIRDPNRLRVTRLRDANAQEISRSALQSVDFHSSGAIVMTAGYDKALRLFRCDGRVNEKLRSVFFDSFPIYSAFFLPTHDEIVVTSRRSHMYSFDLTSGAVTRFAPRLGQRKQKSLENALVSPDGSRIAILGTSGHIDLLTARTKLWQSSVKMNGYVEAACFSSDGMRLFTGGADATVYEWDLRMLATVQRWRDQGSIHITALALSPDDVTLAVGNDSGTVSLFDVRRNVAAETDTEDWLLGAGDKRPEALRECTNLTTDITSLKFSRDGSTMAFASNRRKDALRLYNVSGKCVYANWPNSRQRVGYVTAFAFSPVNDLFTVGDLKGRAQLYRKLD